MFDNTEPRNHLRMLPFAVAAALILFFVGGILYFGRDREIILAIPVSFTDIPQELLIAGDPPVLEVRLRGPSRILKSLKDSQPCHLIDMAAAKPGQLFIKTLPETINVPQRVSVLKVHPASFTISIDKRMEKLVPVEPELNNDPAPGYVVSKVVTTPLAIRLTGPASVLEDITRVRTTPIDLAGLTESAKKKAALNLNHNPYVQSADDSLVEVEIAIKEKIIEEWMNIRVRAKGARYRYEITPGRIKLLLSGPVNTMKKLAQGDGIKVYVDLKGLKPGTCLRPAVIRPPLNTTLVRAEPEVFSVEVFE